MDYNVLKIEMKEFLGYIVDSKKFGHFFVSNPSVDTYLRKCIMATNKYPDLNDYLEFFLKKYHDNININKRNKQGSTLLHLAAENSRYASTERTVEILINAGINIDLQNSQGNTALHISIDFSGDYYGSSTVETIKILINSGANVNLQNNFDNTPLHCILIYASKYINNHETIIKMLICAGADVFNLKNHKYLSPITYFSTALINACEIDLDTQTIGIISGKLTKSAVMLSRDKN